MRARTMPIPIFVIAFLGVFFLVGFGLLGYGLFQMKQSSAAGSWPTTRGTIVSCSLSDETDSDGDTMYVVKIEYSYSVRGADYTGDRLAFGYGGDSSRKAHDAILAKLQSAEHVDVRYDPREPANAVLSFGVHRSIRTTLVFAITWLAFVTGFALILWTASRGDDTLLRNLVTR